MTTLRRKQASFDTTATAADGTESTNLKSSENLEQDLNDPNRKRIRQRTAFLQSLAFSLGSAALFLYLDIWTIITTADEDELTLSYNNNLNSNNNGMKREWFHAGLVLTASYLCIFAYISIYLNSMRNIPIEYDRLQSHSPYLVPLATCLVLGSGGAFTVAFWPVWHLMTVPVLFSLFLGFVATLSLIV